MAYFVPVKGLCLAVDYYGEWVLTTNVHTLRTNLIPLPSFHTNGRYVLSKNAVTESKWDWNIFYFNPRKIQIWTTYRNCWLVIAFGIFRKGFCSHSLQTFSLKIFSLISLFVLKDYDIARNQAPAYVWPLKSLLCYGFWWDSSYRVYIFF